MILLTRKQPILGASISTTCSDIPASMELIRYVNLVAILDNSVVAIFTISISAVRVMVSARGTHAANAPFSLQYPKQSLTVFESGCNIRIRVYPVPGV